MAQLDLSAELRPWEDKSSITSEGRKSHQVTKCADYLIKTSHHVPGFSVVFLYIFIFFQKSSAVQLRPSSEKDNRGSEKTLVACQFSTVRLSFICQSKLVRPYQRETVKGNGNDLFKQKINKENAALWVILEESSVNIIAILMKRPSGVLNKPYSSVFKWIL